ncbi:A1 cistron-splicing factor [Spinellus fusiger]|nr:A1 cistron-splicing factor [Spinellus fusiger]
MDQATANLLFEHGAFLLFFDAPANLEFGIDYHAWTIGPLFKGIKMIPPGLHFIYFSATSKEGLQGVRTGFFKYFESKEVAVREWNPHIEDLREERELDPEQVERYRKNIRDFDRNMGPYPLDPPTYYQRWRTLTSYVTPGLVRRVLPNDGKVSHLPTQSAEESYDNDILSVKDKRVGKAIEKEQGMEFTPFDLRQSFPDNATGNEITKWSLDKSWLACDLLHRIYHDDHLHMLGEMQLAFVCLLMAQNFSGFHQWKQLVQLLCSCQEWMERSPDVFVDFLDTLEHQLEECPEDFFHDILSENNFLGVMLQKFHNNIPESGSTLRTRLTLFRKTLMKRFKWELPEEEEGEQGEDAPMVVEMD